MARQKSPSTLIGGCQLMLRVAILVSLVGLGGALVKERGMAQISSPIAPTSNTLQAGFPVTWIDVLHSEVDKSYLRVRLRALRSKPLLSKFRL